MAGAFLVKYAEIGVKGKNRHVFEEALRLDILKKLENVEGDFSAERINGRIFVSAASDFDKEDAIVALSHVFGIVGISPVTEVADHSPEGIIAASVDYFRETYGNDMNFTFKVDTRRADKRYPVKSMEMDAKIGEALLQNFNSLKVDVHNPMEVLHLELRDQVFIYSKTLPGAGGLPLGTNGHAMLLLSGGFDSPVAGYMVARRGVYLDAVYFDAPPYTSDRAKQKVIDLGKILSSYTGPIRLHIINFTDIQMAIYKNCRHDQLTIIMRRYMMRIAEKLAQDTPDCLALITGESLGQVASQTMKSIFVTDEAANMPVFRPLIGFDKQTIINMAGEIGTAEVSALPYEDCCTIFVAKHPVTKPNLNIIKASEMNLQAVSDELVAAALESDKVILVKAGEFKVCGSENAE